MKEIHTRILSQETLLRERERLGQQGKKVVFTNGCFDVLHRGHVEYLNQARQLGEVLVVGLNSDDSVRRLKGPGRPLMPQEDRAYILASLTAVDFVCIFSEDTPHQLIAKLKPDVLVKGSDYQLHEIVGRDVVEELGGRVVTLPIIPGRSTTDLIQRIAELTRKGIWKQEKNQP